MADPYLPLPDVQQDGLSVHDADTIHFQKPKQRQLLNPRGVRVRGIDANEMANPSRGSPREVGAVEARDAAAQFLEGQPVEGSDFGVDRYKRTLAKLSTPQGDLGEHLVSNLYAAPAYDNARDYVDAQFVAQGRLRRGENFGDAERIRDVPVSRTMEQPGTFLRKKDNLAAAALRGVDQLQGNLYAGGHALARLAESVSGQDMGGAKGWLKEGVTRNEAEAAENPASFNSFGGVESLGDLGTYAAEATIASAPSMVPMLVGGALGRTVLGRTAAATVANSLSQSGEVEAEQMKLKNPAAPGEVLAAGGIRSVLDVASAALGINKALGPMKAKSVRQAAGHILKTIGITAPVEGATEAGQEAISIALRFQQDPSYDVDEAIGRLKESFIAGTLVGGTMSGAGASVNAVRRGLNEQQTQTETAGQDQSQAPGAERPTVDGLPPLMEDGRKPMPTEQDGLPPLMEGGLPPLMEDGRKPIPTEQDGLPPLMEDGRKPIPTEQGGLPPLMEDGRKPMPTEQDGLPPLLEGGRKPMPVEPDGLPPLLEGGRKPMPVEPDGLPPLMEDGLPPLMEDGRRPMPTEQDGLPPLMEDGRRPMPTEQDGLPPLIADTRKSEPSDAEILAYMDAKGFTTDPGQNPEHNPSQFEKDNPELAEAIAKEYDTGLKAMDMSDVDPETFSQISTRYYRPDGTAYKLDSQRVAVGEQAEQKAEKMTEATLKSEGLVFKGNKDGTLPQKVLKVLTRANKGSAIRTKGGTYVSVPEGSTLDEYIASSDVIEASKVEGGWVIQQKNSAGFREEVASGGMTDQNVIDFIAKYSTPAQLRKAGANSKLSKKQGFRAGHGDSNAIDMFGVARLGAAMLGLENRIGGLGNVKEAFAEGAGRLMELGYQFPMKDGKFTFPKELELFRTNGIPAKWGKVEDFKPYRRESYEEEESDTELASAPVGGEIEAFAQGAKLKQAESEADRVEVRKKVTKKQLKEVEPDPGPAEEYYSELVSRESEQEKSESRPLVQKESTTPSERHGKKVSRDFANKKVSKFLRQLADSIGLKTNFYIVDEAGRKEMLRMLRDRGDMAQTHNALQEAEGARIIYNDTSEVMADRVPIIYLPEAKGKKAVTQAAHEFGHLVKRATVDQLINSESATDKALVKALFGNVNWTNAKEALKADEMFAKHMETWALSHRVPRNAIEKFFKKLGATLKKVYNAFIGKREESFSAFMEAMLDEDSLLVSPHTDEEIALAKAQKGLAEQVKLEHEQALARAKQVRSRARKSKKGQSPSEARAEKAEAREAELKLELFEAPKVPVNYKKESSPEISGVEETYQDFVDNMIRREFLPRNTLGQSVHEYTGAEVWKFMGRTQRRARGFMEGKPLLGTVEKTLAGAANMAKEGGAYVRATGISLGELSPALLEWRKHYHTFPGETSPKTMSRVKLTEGGKSEVFTEVPFVSIEVEQRMLHNEKNKFFANGMQNEMVDILGSLPSAKGLDYLKGEKRVEAATAYRAISRELQEYTTRSKKFGALSKEAKRVAKFLADLYTMFEDSDVYEMHLEHRKQYSPLSIDKDKLRAKSLEVMKVFEKHEGVSAEDALSMVAHISNTNGIIDPNLTDSEIFASSVAAKRSRKLKMETQQALVELDVYSDDLHEALEKYTHQIVKRAVEQSRFGGLKKDHMGEIVGGFDPVADINTMIETLASEYALTGQGVNPQQLNRAVTKYLPALRGTLGGDIDPRMNSIMSWTHLGISLALLPLSTLSSIPDVGGIAVQRQTYKHPLQMLTDLGKTASYFKAGRKKELFGIAKSLGIVTDKVADHVLSESMQSEYMTPTTKVIGEKFFNLIQMKRWTDFSRLLATDFAIDTFKSYGKRIAKGEDLSSELKDLPVTKAQISKWYEAGAQEGNLMDFDGMGPAVSQWVDFAILRPNSASVPPVGADPRMKLFWQLKGFMYSFYYTTMKRAFDQMGKSNNFAAALPLLSMAAFMLPLAMAGYELRKIVAEEIPGVILDKKPGYKKPEGNDYIWEMVIRGGLLGPFTVLHDMYEADKHGSLALTALGGPTFSKSVELFDKGLYHFLTHTTPVLAQSSVIRDSIPRPDPDD